jgi:hypothetical protein
MDNVQKHIIFINVPSSQTLGLIYLTFIDRSYLTLVTYRFQCKILTNFLIIQIANKDI